MSRLQHALDWIKSPLGVEVLAEAECRRKASVRTKARSYQRTKRIYDPAYKLAQNMRGRIRAALLGKRKSARTMALIGCTIEHLISHLERQFTLGMTWQNYGQWHVDHIRPCAAFNLIEPREQRACFNWTNLQPLWALDNFRKGDAF